EGTRVLVDAASETKISRFIFPSGLGVDKYGIEDWADNDYFRSKRDAEQIIKQNNTPYVIFRPSYILGPEDELIPEIIKQIGGQTVSVAGNGTIPMQPIFINDAVEAFLAAAAGVGQDNVIYDLVGPEITNMNELIEKVFIHMNELGFHVPPPRIQHFRYENAPRALGICEEMVDVMRCDIISNGNIAGKNLNFKLNSIDEAIRAAIRAKLFPVSKEGSDKAIILLSGGIDSATILYWAKNEGYDPIVLSFNYRYRPEKEKKAVFKLSEDLGIEVIEIPVDYVKEAVELRIEGKPVPSAVHAPEGYIPSRNLVFYSIAAYFAEIYGCKFIIGGHMAADPLKFPDSSPNFFQSLENIINKGKHIKDRTTIKILLPLIKMTKVDVLRLAIKLGVPINWTWSCYNDENKPCGKCYSCLKRKEAFLSLDYSDPEFTL
ncbi:MAG: 7-cyano-7-deazaguanine synthase, partial [Promethearchaeota archaeon]